MAQRARTNKNTSLATSNGSGYNKNNGGSYTGSTTGLSAEKSPLNTQKTDFTAPKKTTITPKKTEENYFQKARETQRELSKPLPRINDAPKKDESNFSLSTGSAQKKENPFTGYFSKKLNLPSREERNFAMGAIGEESERAAYNDGVVEEFEKAGYLKNTKTQDDLFREGFEGVKKPNVYEFTAKADDNVQKSLYDFLDVGKTPKSRMEAFAKIRDENAEQSALEGNGKSQINPSNPDAIEFGEESETYKILQDISKRWYETSDSAEKDRLHGVAEDVRRYHRQGTPIVDRHDAIMNLLHENKKTAQNYQKAMTEGIPGFLYRMSDGNYMLDSSTYLIGMVDEGEWDYKYNKDWQVKYDYFDGVDMDTPKSNYRNWKPWMYFDGHLISADKLGNMNMAYVGKNMGLAEWVYKNFETTDKDDEFWVQYGIDLAKSGR